MYYIGIDLGGTNIAVGLVDEHANILHSDSVPTIKERHWSEIIKDMATLSKKVVADAGHTLDEVAAVGIGCPGTIDKANGVVVYSNNIVMDHVPMAAEFRKHIDLPVYLENDANAAASLTCPYIWRTMPTPRLWASTPSTARDPTVSCS